MDKPGRHPAAGFIDFFRAVHVTEIMAGIDKNDFLIALMEFHIAQSYMRLRPNHYILESRNIHQGLRKFGNFNQRRDTEQLCKKLMSQLHIA